MTRFARLAGPHGPIEWAQYGTGEPTTVFAHGLAGSITGTRPFASGVPGRRVFVHFRGHGRGREPAGAAQRWTYAALADELTAVADYCGAGRAFGVGLGAGSLCALLARDPDRFDRVVLALPAALDQPRDHDVTAHFDRLAELVESQGVPSLAAALAEAYGEQGTPGTWGVQQARALLDTDVASALRTLPAQRPVQDRSALSRVRVPVLVIAQHGDPLHPVQTAEDVAAALSGARLETLPRGGLLGAHRARLRSLVGEFLGG